MLHFKGKGDIFPPTRLNGKGHYQSKVSIWTCMREIGVQSKYMLQGNSSRKQQGLRLPKLIKRHSYSPL